MKKGMKRITQTEYQTFIYENKEEEREHRNELFKEGLYQTDFGLTNLEEGEVCYSKYTDIIDENYIERTTNKK